MRHIIRIFILLILSATTYAHNDHKWVGLTSNVVSSVNSFSNTPIGVFCTPPIITVQPSTAAQSICGVGASASLSVTATGSNLTYQWYRNTTATNTGGTLINGATSSTYLPSSPVNGVFYYYVAVSSGTGCFVTSNVSGAITNSILLNKLDLQIPSAVSYSLRLLSTCYNGYAIQVRRSSDFALQDIGFTNTGELDTAALKTFIGVNSGFVKIWYDQSGNEINAVQTKEQFQPRIVNAGVVDRENGKPAAIYDGSNDVLEIANWAPLTSATGSVVFKPSISSTLEGRCIVIKTNGLLSKSS
jgi:hypothetical protein